MDYYCEHCKFKWKEERKGTNKPNCPKCGAKDELIWTVDAWGHLRQPTTLVETSNSEATHEVS